MRRETAIITVAVLLAGILWFRREDERICIRRSQNGPIAAGDTLMLAAGAVVESWWGVDFTCVPRRFEEARWSSSDPRVVDVSSTGILRAVGAGRAEVVLQAAGEEISASFTAVPPVVSLVITPAHGRARVGDTVSFSVVALDSAGAEVPGVEPLIFTSEFDVAHPVVRRHRFTSEIIAASPGETTLFASMVHRMTTAKLTVVP